MQHFIDKIFRCSKRLRIVDYRKNQTKDQTLILHIVLALLSLRISKKGNYYIASK